MSEKPQNKSLDDQDAQPEEIVELAEQAEAHETGGDDTPVESELSKMQTEIAELKDKLLRSAAEIENLRKRNQREKEDTLKYAISNFAGDMLGVSDNLRRALDAIPDEDKTKLSGNMKPLIEGVELTEKELLNVFKRHGIEKILPVKGDKFSHEYHQAMFEVETNEYASGMIVEIMQPGYKIHSRLLRPAMVGVSKQLKKEDKDEK